MGHGHRPSPLPASRHPLPGGHRPRLPAGGRPLSLGARPHGPPRRQPEHGGTGVPPAGTGRLAGGAAPFRQFRPPPRPPRRASAERAPGRPVAGPGPVRRHPRPGLGNHRPGPPTAGQREFFQRPQRPRTVSGRGPAPGGGPGFAAPSRPAGQRPAAQRLPRLPAGAGPACPGRGHEPGGGGDRRHPGLHGGPQPGPAGRDPARRHGGGGIAHLLRAAAGAGNPGPEGSGNSHQPPDRPVPGSPGTGLRPLRSHRRPGGSAPPAEPPRLHHARGPQGTAGGSLRRAGHCPDRGRHLQPPGGRRYGATGPQALGPAGRRHPLRLTAQGAGAGAAPGLDQRRPLAGPRGNAEVRPEPPERGPGAAGGRRFHGFQRLRPPPAAPAGGPRQPAPAHHGGGARIFPHRHPGRPAPGRAGPVGAAAAGRLVPGGF